MWLLMAAIPVQGLAAGMMITCGPNHERMGQVVEHGQHQIDGVHHDSEVGSSSSDADLASVEESLTAPLATPDSPLTTFGEFKCSACAACCTAAAIPAAVTTFGASTPTALLTSIRVSRAPVFLTGGPERPPRLLLA